MRGSEKREEMRKGELLQSQDTSQILYRTIQVRSTRERRGKRENLTLRRADPFSTKNSTRFVSSVIRFVFNSGLIGFLEGGRLSAI